MNQAFRDALENPMAAQRVLLQRLCQENAGTAYGRAYRFADCVDYAAFAAQVPVVGYDDLAPYIDRVCAGEANVLTRETVCYLGVSSGTTGRKKYIPVVPGFAAETRLWMALERDFLRLAHPELGDLAELRYINRIEGQLPSGIATGAISAWFYSACVADGTYDEPVPFEAFQLADVTARNYAVLLFALRGDFTRLTAVNPSTLLLLARLLGEHREALLRDLTDGTVSVPGIEPGLRAMLAERLGRAPERARELGRRGADLGARDVWPKLKVLSCWVHAGASLYQDDLRRVFGEDVLLWDYGYTSTEGRATVTVNDQGQGVPLFTSLFLELRRGDGAIVPLAEASDQDSGELIVSHARGLYRYSTGDRVEIAGRLDRAPLLRFAAKTVAVASLTGEKLTSDQVTEVVLAQLKRQGLAAKYFCLAPVWGDPPRYQLLLELRDGDLEVSRAEHLAREIEGGLVAANAEYERKRETLRLGPVALRLLAPGSYDRYVEALVREGREAARVKMTCVSMDPKLVERFPGRVVDPWLPSAPR